jgi:predicted nucleic acid-binding protein
VVDTGVFGARLSPRSPLSDLYRPYLDGRPAFISFQTVAELTFGARLAGWGPARTARMRALVVSAEIVWPGPELVEMYAQLRAECVRRGHALGQRGHEADRWIAATARHLGVPLVSHDAVFANTPGVAIETALGR